MNDDSLNISGMMHAIRRKRVLLLSFVLTATLAALVTTLILPKKYYAASKILPANPALHDKGRMFNPNIQHLYSAFGNGDDIDRLSAIATSDPMYRFLCDSFQLSKHYELSGDAEEINFKAAKQLKKNSVVRRTVNGELELGVWDKDKKLSAHITNAMVKRIQTVFNGLMMDVNMNTLLSLREALNKPSSDSMLLTRQISEIEINLNSHPPAFVVVQEASPAVKAGKPRIFVSVIAAFLVSLFLGLLTIVIADKVKR